MLMIKYLLMLRRIIQKIHALGKRALRNKDYRVKSIGFQISKILIFI